MNLCELIDDNFEAVRCSYIYAHNLNLNAFILSAAGNLNLSTWEVK